MQHLQQLFDNVKHTMTMEHKPNDLIPQSSEDRWVLYVRHCESHANVAPLDRNFVSRKWLIPPLCTMRGWTQSFTFGRVINQYVSDLNATLDIKLTLHNPLYCSRLPRAIATCYGIGIGMTMSRREQAAYGLTVLTPHDKDPVQIKCVECMEENRHLLSRLLEDMYSGQSTANTTMVKDTLDFASIIRHMTRSDHISFNRNIGSNICMTSGRCQHDENSYNTFLQNSVRDKFTPGCVNVVVCHGGLIREIIDRECPGDATAWEGNNLESILLRYTPDVKKATFVRHWSSPTPIKLDRKHWMRILFREPDSTLDQTMLNRLIDGTYSSDEITDLAKRLCEINE